MIQPGQQAEQRGLAGSVRSHEADDVARCDDQVEVAEEHPPTVSGGQSPGHHLSAHAATLSASDATPDSDEGVRRPLTAPHEHQRSGCHQHQRQTGEQERCAVAGGVDTVADTCG